MKDKCQHAELAEKLVDDHSRCVRRMHPCARVAGMSIIGILLMIQICAILEYFVGEVSPGVQPRVNSQVNLERQGMQHVASMKTTDHEYYWSARMRNSERSSSVPFTVPTDVSNGPSWSWKNKLNEQVRHSPLIDNDMNIYLTTTSRIRKFTSNGDLLWTYLTTPEEGTMKTSPSLYKGAVIGRCFEIPTSHVVFSLSMQDGSVNWKKSTYPIKMKGGDADASLVAEDVVVFKSETEQEKPDIIFGANATDGSFLWKYTQDEIFWNFSPAYNGDGTFLFSTVCGRAFRMSLHTGEVIWEKGPRHPGKVCGNEGGGYGGGILFAAYNTYDPFKVPGVAALKKGMVVARQASDGEVLWRRHIHRRIANYLAYGVVGGSPVLGVPVADAVMIPSDPISEQIALALFGTRGKMRSAVYLLDATDGSMKWKSEAPAWSHGFAEFDDKSPTLPRPAWPQESICLPDGLTVPLITLDGTVYSAGSSEGLLRIINDENQDGIIEKSEEKNTNLQHKCFLNSPSAAPGMLVAVPCFGDMYVYRT